MSELALGGSWAGGWDEPGVLSVVLIGSTLPGSGLFVYSGTPALGNLIGSITATTGTDIYGNAYQAGITEYQAGTTAFAQLLNQAVRLRDSSSQIWTIAADVLGPSLQFSTPGGHALYHDNNGFAVTQVPGNASSLESWHSMTLLNSWANSAGNTAARYRMVASPPNSVQIQGVLDATAATNSRFFTLPSGYVPTGVGGYGVGANGSVSANQSPQVRWDASGNLSVGSFTVGAAAAVWINGFVNLD